MASDDHRSTARYASRTSSNASGTSLLSRVRMDPPPGHATEADVLEAERTVQPALRAGGRRAGGESHGISANRSWRSR